MTIQTITKYNKPGRAFSSSSYSKPAMAGRLLSNVGRPGETSIPSIVKYSAWIKSQQTRARIARLVTAAQIELEACQDNGFCPIRLKKASHFALNAGKLLTSSLAGQKRHNDSFENEVGAHMSAYITNQLFELNRQAWS